MPVYGRSPTRTDETGADLVKGDLYDKEDSREDRCDPLYSGYCHSRQPESDLAAELTVRRPPGDQARGRIGKPLKTVCHF